MWSFCPGRMSSAPPGQTCLGHTALPMPPSQAGLSCPSPFPVPSSRAMAAPMPPSTDGDPQPPALTFDSCLPTLQAVWRRSLVSPQALLSPLGANPARVILGGDPGAPVLTDGTDQDLLQGLLILEDSLPLELSFQGSLCLEVEVPALLSLFQVLPHHALQVVQELLVVHRPEEVPAHLAAAWHLPSPALRQGHGGSWEESRVSYQSVGQAQGPALSKADGSQGGQAMRQPRGHLHLPPFGPRCASVSGVLGRGWSVTESDTAWCHAGDGEGALMGIPQLLLQQAEHPQCHHWLQTQPHRVPHGHGASWHTEGGGEATGWFFWAVSSSQGLRLWCQRSLLSKNVPQA